MRLTTLWNAYKQARYRMNLYQGDYDAEIKMYGYGNADPYWTTKSQRYARLAAKLDDAITARSKYLEHFRVNAMPDLERMSANYEKLSQELQGATRTLDSKWEEAELAANLDQLPPGSALVVSREGSWGVVTDIDDDYQPIIGFPEPSTALRDFFRDDDGPDSEY